MASSRIPTVERVFGAWVELFDLVAKQPPRTPDDPIFTFGARLGHEPPGVLTSIALRGESAIAYARLQSMMWAATQWGRAGSVDKLAALARHFILEMAVDPGPGRPEIKKRYIAELHKLIGGKLKKWRVVARVPARAASTTRDFTLVGLRFRAMASEEQVVLKRDLSRVVGPHARANLDILCQEFGSLYGRDLSCTVDVVARDSNTAFIVARELIADRLDCLAGIAAACGNLTHDASDPRNWGGPRLVLELRGDAAFASPFGEDPTDVQLDHITENMDHPHMRRFLRLIDKPVRRDGERRLRGALRWLGRSHRASSEVSAYLNGVIAFETLLKGSNEGGIGAGLRLRYAQLKGTTRAERRRLLEGVGSVYDKRSAIVHAREDSVDYDELLQLWSVVQGAIVAFVARGFHLKNEAAIATWFEDQVL
ncbi:MAG: hypothetical protein KIT31_16360 [Deltaproteobacteria bacterium]|nr:hypothetical protein [Deltaproteobacteria bacterium]